MNKNVRPVVSTILVLLFISSMITPAFAEPLDSVYIEATAEGVTVSVGNTQVYPAGSLPDTITVTESDSTIITASEGISTDAWYGLSATNKDGEDIVVNVEGNIETDSPYKTGVYAASQENGATLVNISGDVEGKVVADGENAGVKTDGDVIGSVILENGAEGTIGGSIIEPDGDYSNHSSITDNAALVVTNNVEGSVQVGANGQYSYDTETEEYEWAETPNDASSVKIGGNLSGNLNVNSASTATVGGDVGNGVRADGTNASVQVGGDVTGSVYLENGAEIAIGGDVSGSVSLENGAEATIGGSITKPDDGRYYYSTSVTGNSSLSVSDDVKEDLSVGSNGYGRWNAETERYERIETPNDVSTVTVGGELKGNLTVQSSSNADIKEGVEGSLSVNGENARAQIGGDVTGSASLENGAEAAIAGDLIGRLSVNGASTATIAGDVGDGVNAYGANGSAAIKGNVIGSVNLGNGADATIGGNISKPEGKYYGNNSVTGNSSLTVANDVEGNMTVGSNGYSSWNAETGKNEWVETPNDVSTVTVGGELKGNLTVQSSSNADIKEDVEGSLSVNGENARAQIGGDVTGSANLEKGAETTIGGDLNGYLRVIGVSTATITGDVGNGVWADGENTSATIGGDVAGTINAQNGSEISVGGSVKKDNGKVSANVSAYGNSNVLIANNVDGAVTAGRNGYYTYNTNTGERIWIDTLDDQSSVVVGGNVNGNLTVNGAASARVGENVNGRVVADGDGATAVIEGSALNRISASNGAMVTVLKDVNTENENYKSVLAEGSGTEVEVGGKVAGDTAISTQNGAKVTAGEVAAEYLGVEITGGSTAIINGDVSSDNTGIQVLIKTNNDELEQDTVIVDGTVNSKNSALRLSFEPVVKLDRERPRYPSHTRDMDDVAWQEALAAYERECEEYDLEYRAAYKEAQERQNSEEVMETILATLPEIIVQTIEPKENMIMVTGLNKENRAIVTEEMLAQINYIIQNLDSANIAVYNYEIAEGYMVAKEAAKLTVKSTDSGYFLANVTAGQYAEVKDNGDGTFTITVMRGGDLRLSASIIAKTTPDVDYQSRALVIPNYDNNTLTIDMTTTNLETFLSSTIQSFQKRGVETVIIKTANGCFEISMLDLITLLSNATTITFYIHDNVLDIYVDYRVVTTLSMMTNI